MKKTFYKVMVIDADGTVTVLRDATTLGDIPNIVESDILERGRIAEANANADGIEKVREQTNGEIVTAKIYYAARPSTEPLPLPNGRIYQVEEVMQSPAPFGDSRDASSIDQELSDPASMEFLCAQVGGLSIYVYPDESRHRGRPHCTVAAGGANANFDILTGELLAGSLKSQNGKARKLVIELRNELLAKWDAKRPDTQKLTKQN